MVDSSAVAFLAMSCVSTVWQIAMFNQLMASADSMREWPSYRGLVRTSICRIFAATLYVSIGINVLFMQLFILQVTFWSFVLIQAMWCCNAFLDARLKKQLTTTL